MKLSYVLSDYNPLNKAVFGKNRMSIIEASASPRRSPRRLVAAIPAGTAS
jgi:hypothetical protein